MLALVDPEMTEQAIGRSGGGGVDGAPVL